MNVSRRNNNECSSSFVLTSPLLLFTDGSSLEDTGTFGEPSVGRASQNSCMVGPPPLQSKKPELVAEMPDCASAAILLPLFEQDAVLRPNKPVLFPRIRTSRVVSTKSRLETKRSNDDELCPALWNFGGGRLRLGGSKDLAKPLALRPKRKNVRDIGSLDIVTVPRAKRQKT